MKFHYIPHSKDDIHKPECENLSEICLNSSCDAELILKLALCGCDHELELDEIKKIAQIGDRILIRFNSKLRPWIIVARKENGDLVLNSEDCLETRRFDPYMSSWKDSEIREYLNGDEFAEKFDPEFLKLVKDEDVHTDDYVTRDRFWLLSHEELNCNGDQSSWFKKNRGTVHFPYFTDNRSRIKKFYSS